ncbi:hypothetical protein N8737_02070 [Verrucomicrobia bacterium]|jgi:hypothetical protein|nr:hypothetical protein [Verrucomicrobiota bacterium]MDA7657466.1 hypothetical protein [Verrucomicrobiota bacterium]
MKRQINCLGGPFFKVLLACLLFPPLCHGLQFDVFVGYGGVVREVSWFPVTCEIMNDGPAFTGTIEISGTHLGSNQKRRLTLELPTNTRKRVVIPVFHSGGGLASWDGRLYDESGKLQAEQPGTRIKEVSWEGVIMGAMSKTFAGSPKFPAVRNAGSSMQPEVGRITPDQFPDRSIALEGLSSFYLNSERGLKLTSDQIQALTEWVASGGHLILAIEQPADVIASEWLHPLSPFIPEGVSQMELGTSFFDWLSDASPDALPLLTSASIRGNVVNRQVSKSSTDDGLAYARVPRELEFETSEIPLVVGRQIDGRVLLAVDGVPLVLSASRGRGTVTVLTFSPEREPFRSWKSKTWFWAKLNRIPYEWFDAPRFNTWGGSSVDGIFGSLIESRQVTKLPVKWLLLLLVVYLIVIGPFDHWFLKKIDRQMLTWITFPAYVIVFSLLIYFIGYKLRSGQSEWNEFHLVDVMPGQGGAILRGRTYASIYSPSNKRYDIHCSVPGATFRGEFLGAAGGAQDVSEATIEQGESGTSARIFVPVWTSQLFVADWSKHAGLPVSVEATLNEDSLEIELENLGAERAESIGVIANGRFFTMEGLSGGETRSESIELSQGEELDDFVRRNAKSYGSALNSRKQALGETFRLNDTSHHSMVMSFISELSGRGSDARGFLYPQGMDLTALSKRGEVVVLFFYREFSPIQKLNQFEATRGGRNTLIRVAVKPESP